MPSTKQSQSHAPDLELPYIKLIQKKSVNSRDGPKTTAIHLSKCNRGVRADFFNFLTKLNCFYFSLQLCCHFHGFQVLHVHHAAALAVGVVADLLRENQSK